MEGSSDFKLDLASDRGPGQKEEIKKWRGPVTSSLSWLQIEDPAKKRKLEKWRGPVTSSLVWLQERGPGQKEEIKK